MTSIPRRIRVWRVRRWQPGDPIGSLSNPETIRFIPFDGTLGAARSAVEQAAREARAETPETYAVFAEIGGSVARAHL